MSARHRTLGLGVLGETRCGKSQYLGRGLCGIPADRDSAPTFLALSRGQPGRLYDPYCDDPLWCSCRDPLLPAPALQPTGIV